MIIRIAEKGMSDNDKQALAALQTALETYAKNCGTEANSIFVILLRADGQSDTMLHGCTCFGCIKQAVKMLGMAAGRLNKDAATNTGPKERHLH